MRNTIARKSAVLLVVLTTGIASIGQANTVSAAPQPEIQQVQQTPNTEVKTTSEYTVASPSPVPAGNEQAEEEWAPLILAAARGVVSAARAIPGAYQALASTVRSGYQAFNTYCTTHAWCSAALGGAAGVTMTELYNALRDLI